MTSNHAGPVNTGENAFPKIMGTPGNDPAARRSPFPPLYRAGTGREPGTGQPSWLAEKTETSRRAARPQTCSTCGANLLAGPDHDTCALIARVDLDPVDRITEVVALLRGRQSYDLVRGNLHHREPEHVHSPKRPHPVHLEHRCLTAAKETLF